MRPDRVTATFAAGMRLLVALLAAAILHLAGGAASGDGFGSKPHIVVRAMLPRSPLPAPLCCLIPAPRTSSSSSMTLAGTMWAGITPT